MVGSGSQGGFRRKRINVQFEIDEEFAKKRHKAICEFSLITQKDVCYRC